jgi:hypothetical protein
VRIKREGPASASEQNDRLLTRSAGGAFQIFMRRRRIASENFICNTGGRTLRKKGSIDV